MKLISVSYTTAAACIKEAFRTGSVPYLKGSPGSGKSKMLQAIASQYKLKLIDLRLAMLEPTDLMGLPSIIPETGKFTYLPYSTFPLEDTPIPDGYVGWLLLLDEINQAERPVIKASYKLVLDRMVGDYKLHKNCFIALAGNLDTDRALTEEMGTAMQSRISPHLELRVDYKQWLDWANANKIDYRITSFIDFRPDLLHNFDPDHEDCTYACPRTWENVHKYIIMQDLEGPKLKDIHLPLLAGTIGSGAALEFVTYTKLFSELPKFGEIMANPTGVDFGDSPDCVYALTGLLAQNANPENIEKVLEFVTRLDGEFQALTIRAIRQRNPELTNAPEISEWIRVNADLMIA